MSTTTIKLTPAIKAALITATEMNIDVLNDMALDSLWLNGKEIRELACLSDDEIREKVSGFQEEAWKQIELLVSLQILYSELKSTE